jgi:two-component system cell cycle sensor histidine kinase/response regulator CckA
MMGLRLPPKLVATESQWLVVIMAMWLIIARVVPAQAYDDPIMLKAAVLSDFPPLYKATSQGVPRGMAIDVLDIIAREVGIQVTYVVVGNWEQAIAAVREGRADFVPGIGVSEERQQEFLFSSNMETVPVSLFVRTGNTNIRSLDDLKHRNIAVIAKSAAWHSLKDREGFQLIEHASIESAVFSVLAGEADGMVLPEPVLRKKLAEIDLEDRFKVVGRPILDLRRGYLFPQSAKAFMEEKINPAITRLTNSPTYLAIYQKWYGKPPSFWTKKKVLFGLGMFFFVSGIIVYVLWSLTIRRVNKRLQRALVEQKTTEKALRESEARYRTLFESAPLGMAVANKEMKLRFVNAPFCKLFGYSEEECHGLSVLSLHPMEDLSIHQKVFAQVDGEAPIVLEAGCLRKGGALFRCNIAIAPMQVDGEPSVVGFFSDVTEKQNMLEERRQAEKLSAIGQLAGGIAHDFNNQLTCISGLAELLHEDLEKMPEQRQFVVNILTAVQRSSKLTRQLLAFARKGKYEMRQVDIHELIEEVINLLKHSIDKRIVIEKRLLASPSCSQGDPAQLQNALLNLALNARDAMPDGGVIRFETDRLKGKGIVDNDAGTAELIRVRITDTGHGMSPDVLAHTFEPFFTTKDPGKGTGMGLAAVYGTMKNHGGTVHLESEKGKGTTATLFLPAESCPSKQAEETSLYSVYSSGSNYHVLLVDDEAMIRDLVRRMLEKASFQVATAADGEEALHYLALHAEEVDLVILDMIMPRMDGRTTFRRMKEIVPDIKVLVASGYSMEETTQTILDEGVLGILQKPFQREELLSALDRVLAPFHKASA